MTDIILESIRALVLLAIILYLFRADRHVEHGRKGWNFIKTGFVLLFIGAAVDITDNFESLNATIVLGDTPAQAFIEKVVGYLLGFVFLAAGFAIWLPRVQAVGDMEKGLRKEKDRADFVFDNAPIGICHGHIGSTSTSWNREFAAILGYDSPGETPPPFLPGNGERTIWADEDAPRAILAHLREQQSLSGFEARIVRRNGDVIIMLFDIVKTSDDNGELDGFYAYARDITKSKEMLRELEDSRKRLKVIIDSIPVGIYLVDKADRTVVEVNPAAMEMTGYSREELIGAHCCTMLCPGRKDRCRALEKGDVINHDTSFTRKDGSQFAALKTVIEIALHGNRYFLESFIDISEQKRLEQFKEDVNRITHHDLRSPVSSVITAADLLLGEPLEPKVKGMLETIREKGKSILDQLSISLVLYNIESGAYLYVPTRIDLLEVIRSVRKEIAPLLAAKQGAIELTLDGNAVEEEAALNMPGNKLLAHSVLANLLINAIEAIPADQTIRLELETGDPLVIRITNPGVVPPEIRDTFFEKNSTAGKTTGTGLGTYSAHVITQTMNGDIDMETSDENGTTTVTVRLPFPSN